MDKGEIRERMGFGEGITDAVETWSDGDDSTVKASKTLLEADERNIRLRTDLSDEEIRLLSKIGYFHELVGIEGLNGIVTEFMMLKVSRNRQSRKEFTDSLRSVGDQRRGIMGMFNRNG